jgi:hypothetical protein
MSSEENEEQQTFAEALRDVGNSFLSEPIDVVLGHLKKAAETAAAADDSRTEELGLLVKRLEAMMKDYGEIEQRFLELFFPER